MLLTVYAPPLPRHQSTCPWSGSNWVPELPRRHHVSRVQLSSRPHGSTLVTRESSLIHMTHPSPLLARVLLLDIVVSRMLLPPPQDSRCALSPDGSVTDPPPPFSPLLPFLPLLQAHCPSIFLNWSVRPLHSMNIVISPLAPALPCCICWLDHLRHPFSLPMVHALQPQLFPSLSYPFPCTHELLIGYIFFTSVPLLVLSVLASRAFTRRCGSLFNILSHLSSLSTVSVLFTAWSVRRGHDGLLILT
ncbi:hypothetical protein Agabi119p4_9816 [Agaricus bisporus var. burnettii]|uniref:Uncharacterized protein n=1 Tax=Agaricus bisporus var. burnettii TaxID=192524 RepID=A0A8H7C5B5_AGABI|nr:hypothetical protein Agabi119p4_9816 [Agaricus bisporus var. burnettii]